MKKHLCVICLAATACAFWELVKFVVPFIVFKFREKLKDNHASLLCRAHVPCNLTASHFTLTPEEVAMNSVFSPEMSQEVAEGIFRLWEARLASKRRGGGATSVVHVGPADLDEEDLATYTRMSPLLAGSRVLLVEPHPYQRRRLEDRLRLIRGHERISLEPMAAAVCPGDGDSAFYRISDRFFRDFKETGWLYLLRYWAGLDKQHLMRELEVFCNQTGKVWLFKSLGVFPGTFPSTMAAWLPYIEEVRVPCHTPSGLLAAADMGPEAVDVLIVDAEGYDTQLVSMFAELRGFDPVIVMFEWHLHLNKPAKLNDLVSLVRDLHARGYEIHRHNHDVVAVAVPA